MKWGRCENGWGALLRRIARERADGRVVVERAAEDRVADALANGHRFSGDGRPVQGGGTLSGPFSAPRLPWVRAEMSRARTPGLSKPRLPRSHLVATPSKNPFLYE